MLVYGKQKKVEVARRISKLNADWRSFQPFGLDEGYVL